MRCRCANAASARGASPDDRDLSRRRRDAAQAPRGLARDYSVAIDQSTSVQVVIGREIAGAILAAADRSVPVANQPRLARPMDDRLAAVLHGGGALGACTREKPER